MTQNKQFIAVLFAFLPVFAFAQTPLALSQAIKKGLEQNFDIKIQASNVKAAKNNNVWGQAGGLPSINFTINQNNNLQDVTNPASFVQGITINNNVQGNLALEWVLFDGFSVRITKDRLDNLQKESEGQAKIVIENTVQNIINNYYAVVLEYERFEILKKALQLSGDRYEYMQFKESVGSAVTTDVLLEKSNYLTDSSRVINQELVWRNAQRNLNFLLAEKDIDTPYSLTDSLFFKGFEYNLEDLRAKMLSRNSDLLREYTTLVILQKDWELRKADRMPQVRLNATLGNTQIRQDLTQATFANGRSGEVGRAANTNYNANLIFSVPIFNGGILNRAIQNAAIQQEIGTWQIERLKQTLNQQLNTAFDLYQVRRIMLNIATENKNTSETNLNLAEVKFRNGTINSFEYRILQNNYLDAAFREIEAVYNLIEANTLLLRLTGGILE